MENRGGVGFLGLLCLMFITLKLCNVIDWNWLWVLSPVLIPLGLGLMAMVFFVVIAGTVGLVAVALGKRKRL